MTYRAPARRRYRDPTRPADRRKPIPAPHPGLRDWHEELYVPDKNRGREDAPPDHRRG